MSQARVSERAIIIFVGQYSRRVALRVFVLTGLERPEKADKADSRQEQGKRREEDDDVHDRPALQSRRALRLTIREELLMAIAATKGETSPRKAMGAATAL